MLRNLSQLITTILAIGVSFYAAYLIYLFSMKSSITSKVEEEGYIVLNILEKHTKPLFYTFTGIGNRALISYMIQYPEFSRLDLLDKMLNDAEEMISDPSKKGNISLFEESLDDDLPFAGRLFVFTLDEYLQALFPPDIKKQGLGYSYPYSYRQPESTDKSLFPYGQNGVDEWLMTFERIKSAVNIRMIFLNNFRNDLNHYIKNVQDQNLKNRLVRNNYQKWIDDTLKDLRVMELSTKRIYSLKRLANLYTIKERLPHLPAIFTLCLFTFLIGVIAPLIIDGVIELKYEGSLLNIGVMVVSFFLLFAVGFLTFKDMTMSEDDDYAFRIVLVEMRKYLQSLGEDLNENRFVNFANIHGFLKGPYKNQIEDGLSQDLRELAKGLELYNNCFGQLGKVFMEEITNSPDIPKNIDGHVTGGKLITLTDFLTKTNLDRLFSKNITWIVDVPLQPLKKKTIKITIPSEEEDYQKIVLALKQVKKKILDVKECQICINHFIKVTKKTKDVHARIEGIAEEIKRDVRSKIT